MEPLTAAAAGVAVFPWMGAPRGVALGLIFLAPAAPAAITRLRFPGTTHRIITARAFTLMAFVAYALGAGLGLLLLR